MDSLSAICQQQYDAREQGLQTDYSQGGRELRRVSLSWLQLLIQLHDSLRNAPLVNSPFRERDPQSPPGPAGSAFGATGGRLHPSAQDIVGGGPSGPLPSAGRLGVQMSTAASRQLPPDLQRNSSPRWPQHGPGSSRVQPSAAPSSRVYSSDLDLGLRAALTEMSLRRSSEALRNVHQPTRYFRDFGNSSGVLHGALALPNSLHVVAWTCLRHLYSLGTSSISSCVRGSKSASENHQVMPVRLQLCSIVL